MFGFSLFSKLDLPAHISAPYKTFISAHWGARGQLIDLIKKKMQNFPYDVGCSIIKIVKKV